MVACFLFASKWKGVFCASLQEHVSFMRKNAVNLKNLMHLFFSEVEGIATQLYRSGPLPAVAI